MRKTNVFSSLLFAIALSSLSPLFGWPVWAIAVFAVAGGVLGWFIAALMAPRRMSRPARSRDPYGIEARYRVTRWRLWSVWTPWRVLWAFAMQKIRDAFLRELEKNAGDDAQYRPVDFDRRKDDKPEYPKWK